MELDLTTIVDQTAEKMWDAHLMLSGAQPWADTELKVRNRFKEQILGPIFHASGFIQSAFAESILRTIKISHDEGETSGQTIVRLVNELSK